MNRREPGFLIPDARRAAHVWSLSFRNLLQSTIVPSDDGEDLPPPSSVFYTLTGHLDGQSRMLYHSETAAATSNPAWMPMEWQYLQDADSEDEEAAWLRSQNVELAVYAAAPATAFFSDGAEDGSRPLYFPSGGTPRQAAAGPPLLQLRLDLRELVFLGFDLLLALGEMRPATDAASRAKEAADAPPEAAGLQLDALPVNMLVLWLDDGHYTTPELHRQLRGEADGGRKGDAIVQSPPTPPASAAGAGATAKLDLRRGLDAANKLMQLARDTRAARATTASVLADVAGLVAAGGNAAVADPLGTTTAAAALGARVRALQTAKAALEAATSAAEAAAAAEAASLTGRARDLVAATAALDAVRALLPDMGAELEAAREGASLLCHFVSAKRLSLLGELRALYPIGEVERGRRYTVRGIMIPDRDLTALPEEQVSTALGYTAHVVQLAAKYLGVPLRYLPCHLGSRSTMRDEAMAPSREFPLFWKGATPEEFAVGVLLLQRDVKQLLHSQGVAVTDGHMLASLQRLFVLLLDAPLPSAVEGLA